MIDRTNLTESRRLPGLARRLRPDRVHRLRATVPLGTGDQGPSPGQTLGRCRGCSLPAAGRLGMLQRRLAHPRHEEPPIDPGAVFARAHRPLGMLTDSHRVKIASQTEDGNTPVEFFYLQIPERAPLKVLGKAQMFDISKDIQSLTSFRRKSAIHETAEEDKTARGTYSQWKGGGRCSGRGILSALAGHSRTVRHL